MNMTSAEYLRLTQPTRTPRKARGSGAAGLAKAETCRLLALPGVFIPLKIVSEANQRDHFRVKHDRSANQRTVVRYELKARRVDWKPPAIVKLTKYGPRTLDDDNCASALKAVRDEVAATFGTDDSNKGGLKFEYAQEVSRVSGVRIEVTKG